MSKTRIIEKICEDVLKMRHESNRVKFTRKSLLNFLLYYNRDEKKYSAAGITSTFTLFDDGYIIDYSKSYTNDL